MKQRHSIQLSLLVIVDALLLYGALFLALKIRYAGLPFDETVPLNNHLIPFTIIFFFWIVFFGASGLYNLHFTKNTKIFAFRLIRVMVSNVVVAIVIFYLIPLAIEPRRNLLLIAVLSTIGIFIWRYLYNALIIHAPTSRVLFFGVTAEAERLAEYLQKNPQLGLSPVAFMSTDGNGSDHSSLPHFSSPDQLAQILDEYNIEIIVVLREIKENKIFVSALFQVIKRGIRTIEFQSFYEMITGKIPLSLIGEVWFLENLIGIRRRVYEFSKRFLDIALSGLLLIPVLIAYPFIALAIKLNSPGPVFYGQKRVGRNGKEFRVIKYRSMVKDADTIPGVKGDGPDLRHTKVGMILRRNYLDELPQIINILKGEMSFVGPRPERPEYVKELKEKIPFYEMRLLVTPGITGWAQIHMENDASVEDAPEKMQYDLYYIKNRSFVLDLLISLKTAFTLVRRQGR